MYDFFEFNNPYTITIICISVPIFTVHKQTIRMYKLKVNLIIYNDNDSHVSRVFFNEWESFRVTAGRDHVAIFV